MEKIKKNSNKIIHILLAVVIALQLGKICYAFVYEKTGFHSDELFSYGYANSYKMPFFDSEMRFSDEKLHNNEWLSGELFNSYIAVDEGEQFSYLSLLQNDKGVHPPFYFMVLHTICSFFPENFSWWYGFSLNIVLFILSQILLFLLVRSMTNKNNWLALLVCGVYGFGLAAENTFIYIRMYSMVTFFGLLTFYLHSKLYHNKDKAKKLLPVMTLVTLLGGLTHFHFLVFAGVLSACFCFYYLFKKEYKLMFTYGLSQILSVVLFILIHPSVLNEFLDVNKLSGSLASGYGGFGFEFNVLKAYMITNLTGLQWSIGPSYFLINAMEVLFYVLIIGGPLCFLFRKEKWFISLKSTVLNFIRNTVKAFAKRIDVILVSMLVVIISFACVVAKTSRVYMMGLCSTRYVFVLFPLIVAFAIILIHYIVKSVFENIHIECKWNKILRSISCGIIIAVLFLGVIMSNLQESFNFYFDNDKNYEIKLEDMPRDANYIILQNEYWLLNCMTYYLRNVDNFFAAEKKDFFDMNTKLNELESDKTVYLIISPPNNKEILSEYYSEGEDLILNDDTKEIVGTANDFNSKYVVKYMESYKSFLEKTEICEKFEYVGISQVFGRAVFVIQLR